MPCMTCMFAHAAAPARQLPAHGSVQNRRLHWAKQPRDKYKPNP